MRKFAQIFVAAAVVAIFSVATVEARPFASVKKTISIKREGGLIEKNISIKVLRRPFFCASGHCGK